MSTSQRIPIRIDMMAATAKEQNDLTPYVLNNLPRTWSNERLFALAITEVAHNRRYETAFIERGIDLKTRLRICHGACIPTKEQERQCREELERSGFVIIGPLPTKAGGIGLAFSHESTLDLQATAPWTLRLLEVLDRVAGLYWGWGQVWRDRKLGRGFEPDEMGELLCSH